MKDLKMLAEYFKGHPIGICIMILSAFGGAVLGVMAYYNGWLG